MIKSGRTSTYSPPLVLFYSSTYPHGSSYPIAFASSFSLCWRATVSADSKCTSTFLYQTVSYKLFPPKKRKKEDRPSQSLSINQLCGGELLPGHTWNEESCPPQQQQDVEYEEKEEEGEGDSKKQHITIVCERNRLCQREPVNLPSGYCRAFLISPDTGRPAPIDLKVRKTHLLFLCLPAACVQNELSSDSTSLSIIISSYWMASITVCATSSYIRCMFSFLFLPCRRSSMQAQHTKAAVLTDFIFLD